MTDKNRRQGDTHTHTHTHRWQLMMMSIFIVHDPINLNVQSTLYTEIMLDIVLRIDSRDKNLCFKNNFDIIIRHFSNQCDIYMVVHRLLEVEHTHAHLHMSLLHFSFL